MCMGYRENWEMVGVSLNARCVLNALCGFDEGQPLHPATEDAIDIIHETRLILRYLNGLDQYSNSIYPHLKHFERYDTMMKLNEVLDRTDWPTWDTDLEQWLTNREAVKKYFRGLESAALHSYNNPDYYPDWGCL